MYMKICSHIGFFDLCKCYISYVSSNWLIFWLCYTTVLFKSRYSQYIHLSLEYFNRYFYISFFPSSLSICLSFCSLFRSVFYLNLSRWWQLFSSILRNQQYLSSRLCPDWSSSILACITLIGLLNYLYYTPRGL